MNAGIQRANGVSASKSMASPWCANSSPKSAPDNNASCNSRPDAGPTAGRSAAATALSSIVSRTAVTLAASPGWPKESASERSAASILPPGKTIAPAANAIPGERSTTNIFGPEGPSRQTTRVAAGIASSLIPPA